jgi:hypothetical protein
MIGGNLRRNAVKPRNEFAMQIFFFVSAPVRPRLLVMVGEVRPT